MPITWSCPVCGGGESCPRWSVPTDATESGVDASVFRPSAEQYGHTAGQVLRCTACGHGSLAEVPAPADISDAYAAASDPVSLREEAGQVETGRRAMADIERFAEPGVVCDLGCWTGSLLVAAEQRGWAGIGIEPSEWASARGRDRGLDVRTGELDEPGLAAASCRAVAMCDVLEHLVDPGSALEIAGALLEPGGVLYLTVPDAGSLLARLLGRRWWSVLPMHVQYFTRSSLRQLLSRHGFEVRVVRSHAKLFTARYYAERLGGYRPGIGRAVVTALERFGADDRLVAPNFHDRMAVLATWLGHPA
jgi:SAM-dependent methyltransferase